MQQGCTPRAALAVENEPDVLAAARTVLGCKDWLCQPHRAIHVDPTEASVMPGDTRARTYSDAMIGCSASGVPRPVPAGA